MSPSFTHALRHAASAPRWLVWVLAVTAVTITAVVAVHRHASGEEPTSTSAHSADPSVTSVTFVTSVDRGATISRGGFSRDDVGSARHAVKVLHSTPPLTRKPPPMPTPLAPSNAAETVASAQASTTNVPWYCLGWAREQAGIPSRYADASTAWEHATGRNPGDLAPPKGAAVYWTGGSSGYGHIAISLGNGKVRSSDAAGSGSVATVTLRSITQKWDLEYAGWANSINGYTIPGVARA